MADHEIGAILTLRDNMSAVLRGVRGEQAAFRRDVGETQETVNEPMKFNIDVAAAASAIVGIGLAVGTVALAAGGLAVSFGDDLQKQLNGVQAATGVTDEAMSGMKDTMIAIYNNNFGENFAEIGTAMGLVTQQTGLTGEALQKMTEGAFTLRDTFEMDVAGSVETAGVMMKNFGVDSDQAYNLIVQGAQNGLNKQGDLLDILKEYGPHFAKLGFSAEESMNMLVNGAAGGVFSVDQLGDVVHEFGRKMREEDLSEPLQELGLNSDKYTGMVAAGGETAKQAFQEIAQKVAAIENPIKRNQIGIGIFGDMMGEVGIEGVLAMSNTKGAVDKTKDALGKINAVKYNTFGEAMTGIKKNLETGILLPINEKIMPAMNQFAGWTTSHMPQIQNEIEYAFDVAGDAISSVGDTLQATNGFFEDHWGVVSPILGGIAAGAGAFYLITGAMKAWKAITMAATTVQALFNLTLAANPIGIAVIAVGLLVAAGIALYQNWDTVKAKAFELWDGVKSTFAGVGEWFSSNVVEPIKSVFSDVVGWFDANVIQPILGIVPNWLSNIFSGGASATVTVTGDYGDEPGRNAKGTNNWRGGPTWVGEEGPEIIDLPRGSRVTPNDKIPFDGYIEKISKGSRVQTASENPYNGGNGSLGSGSSSKNISIAKLADQIIVRVESDIDKIANKLVSKLELAAANI